MATISSFPPVIGHEPRILILGSMPGIASLEAVQYYAHPRNAFWPILGELFGFDHQVDYAARIEQVQQLPVILWDTLAHCYRPGSLDSNISVDSVVANDIAGLLDDYPEIRAIAFNGATSEKYFRRLVLPQLGGSELPILIGLPSTSPANAGMTLEAKAERWRELLYYCQRP